MTPKQRAAHREALLRLRTALVAAGPERIEPNRTDPATAGVADEDAQALSEMHQALASQRNREKAQQLARLDAALRTLATAPEDYGLCQDCEEPISSRRLALMPDAVHCQACQARREPKVGGRRKNLTDYR
jgi:DnaK suppressor protein